MAIANNDETTMNLQHDITVNGVKYKAGSNVAVPKAQADDINRMDSDYSQYERNLLVKRTSNVDAGSFSVGNGAE